MRYTLLEIVQRILGAMDSDEVNDVSETAESLEVANIVKECYLEIMTEIEPREAEGLFHLDASGDNTKPTLMYLPSTVADIHWLKYNVGPDLFDTNYRILDYMEVEDFLDRMNGLDVNETWIDTQVVTINGQNFNIKFRNDESPYCYTSVDDRTLLFDSVDLSYENTLTASRTLGFGALTSTFQIENSYIPPLDAKRFQLLLSKAKAQAFVEVKQTSNAQAETKARRQTALAYKQESIVDPRPAIIKHRGFGRNGLRRTRRELSSH